MGIKERMATLNKDLILIDVKYTKAALTRTVNEDISKQSPHYQVECYKAALKLALQNIEKIERGLKDL